MKETQQRFYPVLKGGVRCYLNLWQVGQLVSFEVQAQHGSCSLRPKIKHLKPAAERLALSVYLARKALDEYNWIYGQAG